MSIDQLQEVELKAMFEGETLSKHAQEMISTLFEAAVQLRVGVQVAAIQEAIIEVAAEEVEEAVKQLREDTYRQWLNDNSVELAKSLKIERTEELCQFIEQSFLEHFVSLPDRKIDVCSKLVAENRALHEKLDKSVWDQLHISEAQNAIAIKECLDEIKTEFGLTLMDKSRIGVLMEGVQFTNKNDYKVRAIQIMEVNLSKKPVKRADVISEEYFGEGDGRRRYQGSDLVSAAARALEQ
jgi:hypothetical protein